MKVAIVHEYFCSLGGSEAVACLLHDIFPQAPLYTIVIRKEHRDGILKGVDVRTSFVQRLPFAGRAYKLYTPLFPLAVEQLDLRGYNTIISSSHSWVKGILTRPEQLHICYCHTPMRYAWDLFHDYLDLEAGNRLTRIAASLLMHYVRLWDAEAATRADHFIANSENVARRIRKHYGREATVIYPPVDTDYFLPQDGDGGFYLVVSRLVPYKRVDLAVAAFNELGLPLKVIGTGPELKRLRRKAKANIEFLGWRPREVLRDYLAACEALIFPGEEDFGIVPLEAQSAGRPVIAYAAGGALETVIPGITGVFFREQSAESVMRAVEEFRGMRFWKETIRNHALRFSRGRFARALTHFVQEKYEEHQGRRSPGNWSVASPDNISATGAGHEGKRTQFDDIPVRS